MPRPDRGALRSAIVKNLSQWGIDSDAQIGQRLVYAQNLWTSLCIVWGEATQVLNPLTALAIAQIFDD
jgi:hypothetical protein